MSQALIENALPWAAPAAAWMLTYLLHSTVLLALAAAFAFALGERRAALQEVIWKCALIGGLVTASLQAGLGWTPLAGSWELPGTTGVAAAVTAATAEPLQREGAWLAAERQGLLGAGAAGHAQGGAAAPPHGASSEAPATSPAAPATTLAAAWPALAVVAWLALALFFTGRLAADYLRLASRLRERWPVADGAVAALFGRLLGKSGRRRPVTLTGSERLPVPIAWGLARPEVSLPARVLRDLSPYHQESILAHELAHVLRRDPAWLAAARLLEAVLFFQPLNRLARRRLQEIAEYRCDDRAVELTGRPLELARCLTEVATWRLAGLAALPVPSMASGSSLGRRVRRLVQQADHDGDRGERLPRWVRPAAVAAVLAVALAAPGVTRGKPAPQEPADAPAAAPAGAEAGVAGAGEAAVGAGEAATGSADPAPAESDDDRGWVYVGRSWDEMTPEERDEVRRHMAAARREATEAGRDAREHARQALEHAREQLRHQREALRRGEGFGHPHGAAGQVHGLEGLAGLIDGSVRLGLTAAGTALAALDMPEVQAEVARAMAEVQRELEREMPKMQAEIARGRARAMAEAEHDPELRAELAEALAELEAEMPRIEAEIAAAMAEVEHELALEMPKIEAEVAAAMAEVQRELAAELPKIQAEVAAAMAEAERELAREMPRIEAEIERALAEVERELAAMEAEMESEEDADEIESEGIAPDAPSPR